MWKSMLLAGAIVWGTWASAQVVDIDGDGQVGPEEAFELHEYWKQAGATANDHHHLGQTWIGDDNPLRIEGYFPPGFITFPLKEQENEEKGFLTFPSAPLILHNLHETGNGLIVTASGTGLACTSNKGNGINAISRYGNGYAGAFTNEARIGYGIYAEGGSSGADLVLGGNAGLIVATAENTTPIQMVSNGGALHLLDFNDDSDGASFSIIAGDGFNRLFLDKDGNLDIRGTFSTKTVYTQHDHPEEPETKSVVQATVESPERLNVYSGNVVLDERGSAWVELPGYVEDFNREFQYQLTCVGGYAPVYIAEKVKEGRFKIAGGAPGLEVSWQLTGVRIEDRGEKDPTALGEVPREAEERFAGFPDLGRPASVD